MLRAALATLASPEAAAPAPWIHLEFDIPRLGRRVDAVLVTSTAVIPIEFKVGAKKFQQADSAQAWDYGLDRAIALAEKEGRACPGPAKRSWA